MSVKTIKATLYLILCNKSLHCLNTFKYMGRLTTFHYKDTTLKEVNLSQMPNLTAKYRGVIFHPC